MDSELHGLSLLVHDFYEKFPRLFWLSQDEDAKEQALTGVAQLSGTWENDGVAYATTYSFQERYNVAFSLYPLA